MLPEVEKYYADRETVRKATDEALRDLSERMPWRYWDHSSTDAERAEILVHNREIDRHAMEIYTRRDNGYAKALNGLKASEVPVVAWIAEHCSEYPGEMKQALGALTAGGNDLDDLDAAAAEHGWCNVWTAFRRQMLAAGVLRDQRPAYNKVYRALISRGWSESNATTSLDELFTEEAARRSYVFRDGDSADW